MLPPLLLLSFVLLVPLLLCTLTGVQGTLDLSHYTLTFNQDFTTMTSLGVTPWGPTNQTHPWIAHKPDGGDWVTFQNPSGNYQPFSLQNGYLTIRVQRQSNGRNTGGMLSSVDSSGRGFSQKYGYFEMCAQLPTGLGQWPAFWLLDVPSLVSRGMDAHEIDVLEQYGDGPALLRTTLHWWPGNTSFSPNQTKWGDGELSVQSSMETGFHTYGMDMQQDYLTFYYDREIILQVPNYIPVVGTGGGNKYDRPMFVMVNNAYGGGGDSNSDPNAIASGPPRDMLVKYVKVWQGNGGSPMAGSPTNGQTKMSFSGDWKITSQGPGVVLKGVTVNVTSKGNLVVYDTSKLPPTILWQTNISTDCQAYCYYVFQGDGNFVGYAKQNNGNASPFWGSSTYNTNASAVTFSISPPYFSMQDQNGKPVYQSPVPPTTATATTTAKTTTSSSTSPSISSSTSSSSSTTSKTTTSSPSTTSKPTSSTSTSPSSTMTSSAPSPSSSSSSGTSNEPNNGIQTCPPCMVVLLFMLAVFVL